MSQALMQEAGVAGQSSVVGKQNAKKKDPLMQKAHKKMFDHSWTKENKRNPQHAVFNYTIMAVVPFAFYAFMLFFTAYMFYRAPVGVLVTATIVTGVCILQYLVITHCLKSSGSMAWRRWIGLTCAIATTAGLMVGWAIHYKYMLFFGKYSTMMTYSNVAASQPASQFEDAGSLLFTDGTKVDTTRAVGYRNIRTSKTLCVAPVVDGQMAPNDPIVFFAVGVGCCGWRSSFHCGDTKKSGTKGGMLVLEPDKLVSPAMEWMVDEQFDFKGFKNAIDLSKSVFALSTAKTYRLLHWVKDPKDSIDAYRKRGLEACIFSCLVYFLVAGVFIAHDVIQEELRAQKAVEALTKGKASA